MKINKVTTKFEGEHNGIQFEFTIASLFYLCDQPIHLMQDINDVSVGKDTISAVYKRYVDNKDAITKGIEGIVNVINIPIDCRTADGFGYVIKGEIL